MQFKSLLIAAGLAAAAPTTETPITNNPSFRVRAVAEDVNLNNLLFTAADGILYVRHRDSRAKCNTGTDGSAYFSLKNGELFLYRTESPPQKLFVDLSAKGESGNSTIGYLTGDQPAPSAAETNMWAYTSEGGLTFRGSSFLACPSGPAGAYSLWLNWNSDKKKGNQCYNLKGNVINESSPVNCLYS